MFNLQSRLLEPLSALSHLAGALVMAPGLALLLFLTRHQPGKMASMLVYGLSATLLFATSALFHGAKLRPQWRYHLNRLDHMAIFLFIAGTFTPIVYGLFAGQARWAILATIWAICLAGMSYKSLTPSIHGRLNVSVYLWLAWGGALLLVLVSPLPRLLPQGALILLFLGGLVYSAGFVIYYRRQPDPWPGLFGHHEIWHLFVLGGALCHFLLILLYIVPHPLPTT